MSRNRDFRLLARALARTVVFSGIVGFSILLWWALGRLAIDVSAGL